MHALLGVLLLMLSPLVQAADGPGAQAFSSISRDVVGIGETFTLEVEVVVTSVDDAVTIGMAADGGIEVVRAAPVEVVRGRLGETEMAVLTRQFVLRPLREGVLTVPTVDVEVAGTRITTPSHAVRVYGDARGFYRATSSVLPIVAEGESFVRIGSAFLVAEDALVTAYHVVVETDRVRVQLPSGERVTTRKVWAVDPVRDIAVLHIDPREVRRAGLTPLPLAPPHERGEAGEPAFTAGWPDGVQQTGVGVRYEDLHPVANETVWVSSNRVRPGDSGGPLLDRQGRVVGVVTSGRTALGRTDVLVEDVCLATDPRKALGLRLQREHPYGLREVLDVHARAGANAHAHVLELVTALTQPSGRHRDELARRVQALQLVAGAAPRDPALQFLLGAALDEVGDGPRALEAYRKALASDASYFPAVYALGHHYLELGDYEAAESLFKQTRRGTPYAALSALGLARIYAADLRYAEAEAALRDVLRRDHHFAPALYLLGYCQLAQGRVQEAAALAVRLAVLDKGWAERLRLHLRQPIFQPVALAKVPPVASRQP
jgi:S1-C subfamily serine protease/Flp pilus assembly protein TadD